MVQIARRLRILSLALACGLGVAAAEAATTVRTVQSGGTVQLQAVGTGVDGLQKPEFAPTFSNVPGLQDGPDATGTNGSASASATGAPGMAALRQARKRMVNRSIARHHGDGEDIDGDDMERSGSKLVTSFDGLRLRDQRLANGGNQFTAEPPDQALCVGNGYVVESVNDVIRVYDRSGKPLAGVVDLNTFYGYPAAINRSKGKYGPSITDPSCYFDPQVRRFFHVVLTLDVHPDSGNLTGANHLDLAVSTSDSPLDSWAIYRIPVQNDGTQNTPVHADCPCLGDYPHIGADEHGIYLTTNEFPFAGGFNSAQIYALSKRDLVRGANNLTLVQIDTIDHLLEGAPGFTVWPAVSPAGDFETANRGTEYFLSSLAVFSNSGTEKRLRVWALGNTRSLNSNSPDVTLVDSTVKVRSYGVPPPSNQKAGPTPLGDCINDQTSVTSFGAMGCWNYLFNSKPPAAMTPELLDSNDSRIQQVFYAGGRLYGALDTAVRVGGVDQAGIAYYTIRPYAQNGSVIGIVENQGKIGVRGNNVSYPAIAALPNGKGIISFTLVGADHFSSAAYVNLGGNGREGPIRIAAEGKGPDDGFSGYEAFSGGNVARWGDYGAVAVDNGEFWMAAEYIGQSCTLSEYLRSPFGSCGGTRVPLGNWYTRISRVRP